MIVSTNTNRSNSRRWQFCVLLAALVVLPLGLASAQDYEAVGKRLREAVAAGELTGEQARVMLSALRRAGGEKEDQGSERAKVYLMKVKKELGAAVEAGEISREDAARRYEAAEKEIRERMAAGRRDRNQRAEYEGVERRIRAAVQAGKMTPEEAREKLAGYRRRMETPDQSDRGERRISREDYARTEAELKKAVAAGEVSKEDARTRLSQMRKMMGNRSRRSAERGITVEQYKRAETRMRKMVEEGKAEPEDVERRLIAMRKMIRDQSERRDRERPDWEAIKKRIEGAVESGKITREEADAKYKEIRQRLARAGGGDDKRADYEAVERRLRAAVEAGEMTREEAREKLEAYRTRRGRQR